MKQSSKRLFFRIKRKTVLWYIYLIALTPICLELALRVIGAKPYIQDDYHIKISPENAFIGDDSLAITLNPGTYNITLNKKLHFTTTHKTNKQRKVAYQDKLDSITNNVSVLGCSFTYGYGVNDNEHFVSLLQKQYPNAKFSNHAVIGYGTTQSYFQLKGILKDTIKPNIVVLNFSVDHFNRNALTNTYKRALKIGFNRSLETAKTMMLDAKYPYVLNTNMDIAFQGWEHMYNDWKGREIFALINWLQTKQDEIIDSQKDIVGISHKIMSEMNLLCKNANVNFVVALLDTNENSPALKKLLTESDIEFTEVGFKFSNKNHINYPNDNHPNTKGHKYIASKISLALKPYLTSD